MSLPLKEKRRTVKNGTVLPKETQGPCNALCLNLHWLVIVLSNPINFQMWRSRVYAKNQLHVSRADVCVSRNDLLKLPQASTVI